MQQRKRVTNTHVYNDVPLLSSAATKEFLHELHVATDHMLKLEGLEDAMVDAPGLPVHATDKPHLRTRSKWDILDLFVTTLQGDDSTKVSLEDFLKGAKTGDIVLWTNHDMTSYTQRLFVWAHYTHATIVLRNPEDGRVYLLESSSSVIDIPDMMREETHDGISLVPASSTIAQYSVYWGEAFWRPMHIEGGEERDRAVRQMIQEAIATVYTEWRQVDYESNMGIQLNASDNMFIRYIASMLPRWVGDWVNIHGRGNICSVVVAEVLIRAGVMHTRKSSYEYSPEAFGERHERLDLAPGVSLGWPATIVPYKWNDRKYWDERMKRYGKMFDRPTKGIAGFLHKLGLHAY